MEKKTQGRIAGIVAGLRSAGTRRQAKQEKEVQRRQAPRPKLLVSIVNRGSGRRVKAILNERSAALSISFTGYGTARSALLDYLGIGETEKTVVLSLIPETDERTILKQIKTELSLYLAGKGISFTMPLSAVSGMIANGLMNAATEKTLEDKVMKQEDRAYNLIVCAVGANHVYEAVEAARAAGASGGTVIRARATDNQKAEQFIGVGLLREQELLLILAKTEAAGPIMDALNEKVGIKTEAGGVIYALPVDRTSLSDFDAEKREEDNG